MIIGLIKDKYPGNPLDTLRSQGERVIKQFASIINKTLRELLMVRNLEMVGVQRSDFDLMLRYIEKYALLPRNALHVSVMMRLGIQDIASDDPDFDRVSVLQINKEILSRNELKSIASKVIKVQKSRH